MRIVFMGTPDFAVPALQALYQAGHEIVAVYCQPPRPAGRGRKITPCAVQNIAEQLDIPVFSPIELKNQPKEFEQFASFNPDIAIVAAYGLILPEEILTLPKLGCINIHASLLPRWRGASPIQTAIWSGDHKSGVSIMQMDKGLDTGAVYIEKSIPITKKTTTQILHDQLAQLGGELILKTLSELTENPNSKPVPQLSGLATYARQLTKEDGKIDWNQSAESIDRQIRALTPWPGTFCFLEGKLLKILKAELSSQSSMAESGTIIHPDFYVACGENQVLKILELQLTGKKKMPINEFLKGYHLKLNTKLV